MRKLVCEQCAAAETAEEDVWVSRFGQMAFIERVNRMLRAHVPGLGRREDGLAETEEGLHRQLVLVMGYYDLCLPHDSLRERLARGMPTKGDGLPKVWRARTPAMAAGLMDHLWSMRELLLLRVPPWHQEGIAA